ncbi:MAG: ABC transporter permease [Bacilli bacterium]|jgi:oligopeptide transport system permease protein|nr:ABC transporter permease [Bacilli bacterium]
MWKYILQRIALIFVTAFIILSASFFLLKLLPSDFAGTNPQVLSFYRKQVALGYCYQVEDIIGTTAKHVVTITSGSSSKNYYFNDFSIPHQYGVWLYNIFTKWDWGTSTAVSIGSSAMSIISTRLGVSMKLNILSMFFSLPIGFFLGITSALKKNSVYDNVVQVLIMVCVSIPSFVLISFLILLLSFYAKWLPSTWPSTMESAGTIAAGYVIPVMCLCFGTIAGFTRWIRAELTEVMSSEFLLLARTKGLTKGQTVLRHALRNSMVPIFPMIIGEFIGILSGSMILEQIYAIPGIGFLYVNALNAKDYNVVMTDLAVVTMISLAASLIVDLSYGFVDPRIRMGARK